MPTLEIPQNKCAPCIIIGEVYYTIYVYKRETIKLMHVVFTKANLIDGNKDREVGNTKQK